jgi:tetratricopeptide (TPR) repeat protein
MKNTIIVGKSTCFIDMPFGKKVDHQSGAEIDFDHIYTEAIKPAVEVSGLQCIRGDMEHSGGIIHTAMLARLLLSEFVIADLTLGNPNVFYELGVRHTAKPYSTIPIFATISELPFDVGFIRAIPYNLENGKLSEQSKKTLISAIKKRIDNSLHGPVSKDSPLFQLFDNFPGIEMSHEVTDVFRDRVKYSQEFKDKLLEARQKNSKDEVNKELKALQLELGDIKTTERGILIDLFLSYRDAEAFNEMLSLYNEFPSVLKDTMVARQQCAFALNRQGEWRKAVRILENVLSEFGGSAETYGLLGRIYKDRYNASEQESPEKEGYLDKAITTYTKGFESEPMDYYPGVNAITLLMIKSSPESNPLV